MAALPLILCITNTGSLILLGPAPIGVLAGLPMIIGAVILLFKSVESEEKKKAKERQCD